MKINLKYEKPNWVMQIIDDNEEALPVTVFRECVGLDEIYNLTKILMHGDNIEINVDFTRNL